MAESSTFRKLRSRLLDGERMETVIDFISGGSKITADGDCSHEIKRRLLLGTDLIYRKEIPLKIKGAMAISLFSE